MQKLDLDMIRINISEPMISSFGDSLNIKSVYSNTILEESLTWLDRHLSYYIKNDLNYTQTVVKYRLIEVLNNYIKKPQSNSVFDKITFNVFFNWALNRIVKFIVTKIFELIFVGNTLELNSKYLQNNPENID